MSFSKVHSGQSDISGAKIVDIEADLTKRGLFSFSVVGLPDKAVEESKDRMSSAIKNSGFGSPKAHNHKIVISLAPADIKKEGPAFDLPIALSYLLSSEEINFNPKEKIFLGELSLDGKIRKINGVLPVIIEARKKGFKEAFIPKDNIDEAVLVKGIEIFGADTLEEIIFHLTNLKQPGRKLQKKITPSKHEIKGEKMIHNYDISEIKGQETAKRTLEIAAAGGHNVLMYGPPGTGKTMLAKAFASILPPLEYDDILEATSIHSIAGSLENNVIVHPPFRSPHHTSSYVSVIGGGANLKPGEITMAHKGVLFLDEFPEFDRRVLESLREPLEEKKIAVARAKGTAVFPADFILVAAMNPCPCGNFGSEKKKCVCPPIAIQRYQRKISGPILDRLDIYLEIADIGVKKLSDEKTSENSEAVRERVMKAREIQKKRFEKNGSKSKLNSEIKAKDIMKITDVEPEAQKTLELFFEKLSLSPRAFHRVIRLSRTIADLAVSETIKKQHALEALQYRQRREIV